MQPSQQVLVAAGPPGFKMLLPGDKTGGVRDSDLARRCLSAQVVFHPFQEEPGIFNLPNHLIFGDDKEIIIMII